MHTIKIKINGAEFEASGEEAAVAKQYAEFVKLVASVGPSEPKNAVKTDEENKGGGRKEIEEVPTQALMDRVFRVDGDLISLNALPQGENAAFNTVLLLLYGHDKLAGRATVMVDALIKGLQQSGAQHGTYIAAIVGGHPGLVTKAGIKRGTRYGLTNKGRQQAEEVLRSLL